MKDQSLLRQKLKKLKELTREIEQLALNDKNVFIIAAGWSPGSIVTGLYDMDGRFMPSGPKAVKSKELEELGWSDKFKLLCKGIHRAIGMIPPTQLPPYLEEDGPQIILKLSAAGLFSFSVEDDNHELAETMQSHIKNYRIRVELLTNEEYEQLLELE